MPYVLFYLGSILLANWLVHTFGILHFEYIAFPAGAIAIGLTFSARDFVQREYGKWKCWIWMVVACILTGMINPKLAAASMGAFLCAETIDWCLFTFSKYSFKKRLILSNLISTPIDSAVFVTIAFGYNWDFIWGQAIVKFISSLIPLLFIANSKFEDHKSKEKDLFTPEMKAADAATLKEAFADDDVSECCGKEGCACKPN